MADLFQVEDDAKGSGRKPLDLYPTPAEVAREIVQRLGGVLPTPAEIIEPSAGPGRFVAASRAVWPVAPVTAIDIDEAHRDACHAAGAGIFICDDWQAWAARIAGVRARAGARAAAPLLILGNPPYLAAQAHVAAALELLRPGEHLVFLLRLAFLGAEERVAWWPTTPLRWVAPVIPRVSFTTDGGTESGEYGVFCWEKGYTGRPELAPHLLWGNAKRKAEAARQQLDLLSNGTRG